MLLLVGLVQLAYCDLTRRLLPKTLVYALSAAVIVSGVVIAGVMHEWQRLLVASLGGLAFFGLFFVINLMNPRWLAFGDVRLSLVVGFGLAWVSPVALLEGFFFANLLAAVIGFALDRRAPGRARVRRALRPLPGPRGGARPRDLELSAGLATVLICAGRARSGGRSRWRSAARACPRGRGSTADAPCVPVAGPSVSASPSAMARYSSPVQQHVAEDEPEGRSQERHDRAGDAHDAGSGSRPRRG